MASQHSPMDEMQAVMRDPIRENNMDHGCSTDSTHIYTCMHAHLHIHMNPCKHTATPTHMCIQTNDNSNEY